ncbi:28S ribosomal protein S5, mitochondrial [Maudiozyma exigua]|uniref:Small ribosomal subunit protein uS5m n=1 Tax=Maudiozyma exigua TaxID=34358 RepID=A0A9P6WG08_MAUEX|nr:28S ribosomal protein S5, mitochondrial [Kazachstania exigua]
MSLKQVIFRRQFSNTIQRLSQSNDALLSKYYPAHLLKSIKLAQETIPDSVDLSKRTDFRFASAYEDDYSKLHPFWDHNPNLPNPHSQLDPEQYTYNPYNYKTPEIPENTYPPEVKALATQSKISKNVILAQGISKQTGFSPEYITRTLKMKPLVLKRVSNQTGKGKIASFYALVIVGDQNGMIGLGEGKSRNDMSTSIFKAHWDAIRNLKYVPRYENRTIFSDLEYRYHGVKLFLRKKEPGFGLRVNHVIFEICQLLGIKDLSAKVYKSRNDMNIAKGLIEALTEGQRSLNEIALGRGKKIVDIRKVYYSDQ